MQPATRAKQLVGDDQRAGTRAAAAQNERHELVVAKRGRAVAQQLLARPIVGRQVFHRTILAMMSRAGALLVLTLVAVAGVAGACGGEPPDREMQQAQGAIDAARAAGADVYAAEELTAAQTTLKRAEDAVAARDYRLALSHALDSRERAQNAAKLAADGKAAARVDADRAINEATSAITALQIRLKAPPAARLPVRVLARPRAAVADSQARVQEARTAVERGDYAAALTAASAAKAALTAAARDLDAAAAPPSRRRR
jgi:hypothetical protein